ncbi:SMI1/KNR4 family protein [Paucimonas lemoignei]|uniref:SMI1/KNR4 family protein n=1 Tax=Paucimonas lemoignei TaxID=29443 RepID=UPI0014051D53
MDIASLLAQNQKHRLDDPLPSEADITNAESSLGRGLPEQYKVFLRLGGLNDLRFNHEILSPSEILHNRTYLPSLEYVPFASNGCGDLFCWKAGELDDPQVYLWEHDSGKLLDCGANFVAWLAAQRF